MRKIIILMVFLIGTDLIADVELGEEVYKINCAICHTVNGGSAIGPDFNIVSYKRRKNKIRDYIDNPANMYKEFGYSANAMPKIVLDKKELNDVADYISSLQPFKKWMIKK